MMLLSMMGCVSVGVPQYHAIAQRITLTATELDAFTWTLSFGDYQTEVLAINLDNGTGFTSQAGDALIFDGQGVSLIAAIAGHNTVLSFELLKEDGAESESTDGRIVKQALVDGQLFEMVTCEPMLVTVQNNMRQRCQGEFDYVTHITYQNGQIVKIEQDMPFYNTRLVLTK